MRIDIATLFPEMCEAVLSESIVGRARKNGLVEVHCHNIRDYTLDKHNRVDDTPYGGGKGMVMQADPIWRCYQAVCEMTQDKPHVIYLSPQGKVLTQAMSVEYSKMEHLFLLCGHYEGVDQRAIDLVVDEEISLGDFVLTGGEIAAMALVDAVARYVPGVLGSGESTEEESFSDGLLEYPQYTRPRVFEGLEAPEVLLSGDHARIRPWRRQQALLATLRARPDLFEAAPVTEREREWALRAAKEE